ncbi:MAG: hypothetical protein OXR68_05470 [Alphaproteobacteria bacterium]|nr:hypothetical protein [Alphaproteobacteria bacterium]MDD9920053.1 hypothetical protein [Alphaproteobacteria bacterium]
MSFILYLSEHSKTSDLVAQVIEHTHLDTDFTLAFANLWQEILFSEEYNFTEDIALGGLEDFLKNIHQLSEKSEKDQRALCYNLRKLASQLSEYSENCTGDTEKARLLLTAEVARAYAADKIRTGKMCSNSEKAALDHGVNAFKQLFGIGRALPLVQPQHFFDILKAHGILTSEFLYCGGYSNQLKELIELD